MKRKLMLLLACLFVGIGLVTAQTQKVTGVVISDRGSQLWSLCNISLASVAITEIYTSW